MTIILHWVLKRGDWLPEIPFTNYSTDSLLYHFISNEAINADETRDRGNNHSVTKQSRF